jgi:hypothetical protein
LVYSLNYACTQTNFFMLSELRDINLIKILKIQI